MSVRPLARPVAEGFAPYRWAASVDEVARRHGLDPAAVLKFDQNTPPLPGVPQVPLAESMARLNEYPEGTYRELREAAAAYAGVGADNVVVGAGADDLILLVARTFLGPGLGSGIAPPTYALYSIASQLAGATVVGPEVDARVRWVCNPNNPTGEIVEPEAIAELARSRPETIVVADEAYLEYGARSVCGWVDELPNLVVLRTLSKAFGLAALRVGYALAHPDTAALLTERRAPAPIAAPAARIAAAALREPRLEDVLATVVERERLRASLTAAGYDCPAVAGNFVLVRSVEPLAELLEKQGMIVRAFPDAIRITVRRPSENDLLLQALGAEPGPAPGRSSTVLRTTTETALRLTLDLDGSGRCRVATGVGFLDHLLTLLAFHAGFDLDLVAGGDLDVDEHHTVEDVALVLGAALAGALGDRSGIVRFGDASVPMDEALATAVVDVGGRPYAVIDLPFRGERMGGLSLQLVPHALEALARTSGTTLHLRGTGSNDHHLAEAAFKALGLALRAATSRDPRRSGVASTKGALG